jgi:hypothetical protein
MDPNGKGLVRSELHLLALGFNDLFCHLGPKRVDERTNGTEQRIKASGQGALGR